MQTRKTLTVAYIAALLIVASFAVFSHVVVTAVLNEQEGAAEVINVAGRQRMLSQRIALLAREFERTGLGEYRSRLVDAIDLMDRQHEMLLNPRSDTSFEDLLTDRLRELYADDGLDQQVTEFLNSARSVANASDNIDSDRSAGLMRVALVDLLNELDHAVKLYEVESDGQIRQLTKLQLLALAIMLSVLAAEAMLIFRPLVSTLETQTNRLEKLAHTDGLTGLANRRAFDSQANREFERVKRHGGSLSILVTDLDFFKQVNDTYGHEAGDRVLQDYSDCLLRVLRASDISGRTGGEEFSVLMPDTGEQGASKLANRLLDAVSAMEVPVTKSETYKFTFSGGVAELQPGERLNDLLRRADAAMYQAKREGRARIVSAATGNNDLAEPNIRRIQEAETVKKPV